MKVNGFACVYFVGSFTGFILHKFWWLQTSSISSVQPLKTPDDRGMNFVFFYQVYRNM